MSETKQVFAEFRLNYDGGDPWGSTMAWWFAVADALTEHAPDMVPGAWEFRQSPFGPDTEQYEYQIVSAWSPDTLRRFGRALSRHARCLKTAGRDY